MPDFTKFLDLSALFVSICSILFGAWYSEINLTISKVKPLQYRNRKQYIEEVQAVFLTKSIPLFSFLSIYCLSLLGTVFRTVKSSEFTLDLTDINPSSTLFCLTYVLTLYLTALAGFQVLGLFSTWWGSGSDRPTDTPRITLLR